MSFLNGGRRSRRPGIRVGFGRGMVDVGLEVDHPSDRDDVADPSLNSVDVGSYLAERLVGGEPELARDHEFIGAEVEGFQVDEPFDLVAALDRGDDAVSIRARGAFADEQALRLDAERDSDQDQERADHERADGVVDRIAGQP